MTNKDIKVGTKVICNWYEGIVTEVDGDMLTIRLHAGSVVAFRSEFGRFDSHKIIG